MPQLTSDEIQQALDTITALYDHNNGFISAEYTKDQNIVVRLRGAKYEIAEIPPTLQVACSADNSYVAINVKHEIGPDIKPSFGHVEEHPPFETMREQNMMAGEMGGDQCRNANSMNYYGTISFYANSVTCEMSGSGLCRSTCTAAPALVSNNHVIGRSDAGQRGEVIWTPFRAETARLECLIPFSCPTSTDFAMARVNNMSGISTLTIRSIGRIASKRRPNIGEGIKKHGARTGYTTGSVTGQSNIRVGSYTYYRVFSTSAGFSCPGDSGSAVLANNNDLVGILSWGDDVACENNPKGYFWTLVNPGSFTDDSQRTLAQFSLEGTP
jgi:hypothetical protein